MAGEAEDRTLHVWVRFQLQLDGDVVVAARFQVFGCPHTVAAASVVAEWLEGRPVAAARELDVKAVCAQLAVPAEKIGKLLRIEDAVAACCAQRKERARADEVEKVNTECRFH